MKAQYGIQVKPIRKPWINRYVKICVLCGNADVLEYPSGLFCCKCGTSLYFGRNLEEEEVN